MKSLLVGCSLCLLAVSAGAGIFTDEFDLSNGHPVDPEGVVLVPQPRKATFATGALATTATNLTEVTLSVTRQAQLPAEGYALQVDADGIRVTAADAAGEFYARQTLRQLAVREKDGRLSIPYARIEDAPSFAWRGVHLDEARHFLGKRAVKRLLELMGYHKLNVLHWHLVDSQGWRVEIPGCPELTRVGAVRKVEDSRPAWFREATPTEAYGPCAYTVDDIREIVAYAAARQIRIVPEIEIPGHSLAALKAYPQYSCTGKPEHVYCPGNDATLAFLDKVLDEVCKIFPCDAIHIGGDEVSYANWKACPKCQARMKAEGLTDVKELHAWIMDRFAKRLTAKGRRAIGWAEATLPKEIVTMSWRGNLAGVEAAARGGDVVMAPNFKCYFDYPQGIEGDGQCYAGCKAVTVRDAYLFDPCADVPSANRARILGGQCCNWTEFTCSEAELEWKLWPRACATAESLWLGTDRDWTSFRRRIRPHARRLAVHRVNVASLPSSAELERTRREFTSENDGFRVGCNYWASHAGMYMWRRWDESVVRADFKRLASHGMTMLRVFPLWPDFQPLTAEFGARGVFHNFAQAGGELKNYAAVDDEMVARFRRMCDLADENGLRLVVGLVTGWMSCRMFAPPALERMNALTDPVSIQWQCRYVRYLVNALKDHPAITSWDLGNECNCMGECDGTQLWNWMHAIASEIRLADPTRPVVSGMHGISSYRHAIKNLRSQGELVDVLTTHPYPLWTAGCNTEPYDTIRNGCHAACETAYCASLSGRAAFVEEAGSMGPGIVSDARAAASMRTALFSCWSAGVPAFLWWCSSDFDRLDFAPYEWTVIERELGLFRSDGTPKPAALVMRDFANFVKELPLRKLPPRQIDAVVLVSESEDTWLSSFGAWTLAREAGFDVTYAFADSPLPDAKFYILPSGCLPPAGSIYETYSGKATRQVLEKARGGATVLVTLGDGAVMAGLRAMAGVEVESQYQQPCRIAVDCGQDSFEIAESQTRRISVHEAKTLVSDKAGNPVMTEHAYGKGRVLFVNGAIERNAKIAGWPLYRKAAERAGVKKVVRTGMPTLCVSEHPAGGGTVYAVLVNYAPEPVKCELTVDGTAKGTYGAAKFDGKVLSLGANDGCVLEVKVRK